jgi:hypothetical protein
LDEDVSIRDKEKCCVCGDFEPKALRDKPYIEFVKWAQCVVCCHWVHRFFAISVAFKTSPPLLAKKSPTEIESLLVLFVI